jgi:uncharacterized Zn-binding protein involved in type VI secretion
MFPVSRFGDLCVPHPTCPFPHALMFGSPNTYCNGRPISFVGCFTTPHLFRVGKFCLPHVGFVSLGAITVTVNGIPMARVTSPLTPICTAVAQGSISVFVGL